jgi:hypothetical protein
MPAPLTPALAALRQRLGASSPYTLNATTLAGTNLAGLLGSYLGLPAGQSLTIASTQGPVAGDGVLLLAGTANVLGLTGATVNVTFVDSAGGTGTTDGNSEARAIDLVVSIAPATAGWKPSDSLPSLAGSFFDQLTLASPTFLVSSQAGLAVTPTGYAQPIATDFGLSLAASTTLSGPLARLAALTGIGATAPQLLYGPIAFTTGAGAVACVSLSLPAYSLNLPPFPSPIALGATLQSSPGATSGVAATAILLSAPQPITGVGLATLSGVLPASGPIALSCAFDASPSVTVDNLNPWNASAPISQSLPAAIRSSPYELLQASLTLNDAPAGVVSTGFVVETTAVWTLSSAATLKSMSVQIVADSPTVLNVEVDGYLPVPDPSQPLATTGVGLSTISDSGFGVPVTFQLSQAAPAGVVTPSLQALANFIYPAWGANLPAALSSLGAQINIAAFGATLDNSGLALTCTAAAKDASAAWPLLTTTPQPLSVTGLSTTLAQTYAGVSSASVSGSMGLGSPAVACNVSTAISGATFTTYTFAIQASQSVKLGNLSASLCGAATPSWIRTLTLAAGTLRLSPGAASSVTGSFAVADATFAVPVPTGGQSPSSLSAFTGLTIGYASSALTSTIGATWQLGSQAPYVGSVAYPYTQFDFGGPRPIPIPQEESFPDPPDPTTAAEIASYVMIAAGGAITIGTVAAAIYAAAQGGGYAVVGNAVGVAGPSIWARLPGALYARCGLLIGGLLLLNFGWGLDLYARATKQVSNGQATTKATVNGLKTAAGASAYDAGEAVLQAYSLTPAETAEALAPSYEAPLTAAALYRISPSTYPTAQSMVAQLSDPNVYGDTLTPTQMTAALAAAGYPPADVAAAILQKYGSAVGTAALMAPVLQNGWQGAGLTLSLTQMIQGLAACNFSVATAAPAVIPLYTSAALNDVALAIVAGYQAAAPVSGMQLAIAFAAAGQTQAATQTAVQAALTGLTSDQWTAIAAVAFATGQSALLTLALAQFSSGASAAAAAQAIVTAQPAVTLPALAGNLYSAYSAPNLGGANLAVAIKQAYLSNPPPAAALNAAVALAQAPAAQTALAMITLLAASGYAVAVVAPAAAQGFPQTAGTPALLAPLLQQGYQAAGLALAVQDMATGLAACTFSVIQSVPAIVPLYTSVDLGVLTTAVVAAWTAAGAAPSGVQAGLGLAAAGQSQLATAPALRTALPALTAAQMLAVLSAAYDPDQAAAAQAALTAKAAGQTAGQAALAIVTAQPAISAAVVTAVIYAVYSPPNLAITPLAQAAVAGLGAQTPPTPLGQALPTCYFPAATTATALAQALVAALTGIQAVPVATALKAAGYLRADATTALLAAGFSQAQTTQAIIQVYGGTSLQLIGSGSNVQIPTALAPAAGVDDFSIEVWVQASTGQGGVLVCHQGDASVHNAGFSLQATPGGSLAFTLLAASGSTVSYQNNAPVVLFDGRPHYIAATRQSSGGSSTLVLYLDGQPLAGAPTPAPLIDVTATAPLYIGAPDPSQGLGVSWVGNVWNVALWTMALSAATVAQHAAAGTIAAPQQGLVGYWPMTDDTVNDESGNGQNGVLQGGAVLVPPPGEA